MKYPLLLFSLGLLATPPVINAEPYVVNSPDRKIEVSFDLNDEGKPFYTVEYDGKTILEQSPLGLVTNRGDLSKKLKVNNVEENKVEKDYKQSRIKKSGISFRANSLTANLEGEDGNKIDIIFIVSNDGVGIRYRLPKVGEPANCIIEEELTGFNFPQETTTFLTPQATAGLGWKGSKPSYEEEYVPDEPLSTPSKYGIGYTFPALFHVGDNGWALISETGVNGGFSANKLSEGDSEGVYTISFPEPNENNGLGMAKPSIPLPGETPWRTIVVGSDLTPIVENTMPFDLVEPLYEPSVDYKPGKGTWSWIVWQDNSMNYADQKTFIDLAADLGWDHILIDAGWDTNIGYEKMEELMKYAHSKNVDIYLWYNSNGLWNNTVQSPVNKMNNPVVRKKELKWMKENGVKGIKVDFFGGDKQETMQLYEQILSDANDYGIMVIFHGCTIPRGWERMYPNYIGSEAVLASENLIFNQHWDDNEAYNATLHPFIRNSIGSMEFGPVILNKRLNRNNNGGTTRVTTDIFQIATSVLFQNPAQNFGLTPNNLTECEPFVIDFMKNVPTLWDDTKFIAGYPGKYVVLARRSGDQWYVVGINAEKTEKKLTVELPMFASKEVDIYFDKKDRTPGFKKIKIGKDGKVTLNLLPDGGTVITGKQDF